MSEAKPDARPAARPISPHLQVWRWHITMATSILHRATGVALYGGALLLALWAACLAAGPGPFELYRAVLGSIPGKLALIALTFSIFFHMANGVRHLVWDSGHGFEPKVADQSGTAVIAFAVVLTVLVWADLFLMGGAS